MNEKELAIISFVLRHKISGKVTDDLLKLIKLMSPTLEIPPNFAYLRKKYIRDTESVVKYVCAVCNRANDSQGTCQCGTIATESDSFFVTFKLSNILREKMEEENFRTNMQHKLNRPRTGNMEDIYDSSFYKSNPHLLLNGNVGIGLNTDGVQLFKKSSYAFWPLFSVFYDLPPTERYKFKNIALAGMWFGNDKPNMNLFLKACIEDIKASQITPPIGIEKESSMKLFLVTISADLPAKALLLNSLQFNGEHGCHICEEEGVLCEGKRCWTWNNNPSIRTHESMLECAREAVTSGNVVKGVKGPSILAILPGFKLPSQVVVDYMHMFPIGVGGKMLDLFFNSKYHDQKWYLKPKIQYIDHLLKSIKV
eukprot:Pompholyxophrys_sp_v1_NODE_149_length_1514_cov_98.132968.p1 type:complete len:367 gc:universal NODE_149_length_1514_cov_98.132968:336-1436(+)